VSAILEALKKLEQETTEPSGHPLRPEFRNDRRWRWTSLAGGLVISMVLFGLAGYGVVALTGKVHKDPAPAAKVPEVVEAAPLSRPSTPVTPPRNPVSFQDKAPVSVSDKDVVAVVLEDNNLPEETIDKTEPSPSPPADEHEMSQESEAPPANTLPEASTPKRSPDIIHDPEMVLQAISWSQDVGRRMAVINGKICREREPIGGYMILKINPEDVMVSKGSVTGRLVFKIR